MNVEKLRAVVDRIESLDGDDDFDMSTWVRSGCGTVACFAGWTCVDAGMDPVLMETWLGREIDAMREEILKYDIDDWMMPFAVPQTAARLLDLTSEQAVRLFFEGSWPGQFRWFSDEPGVLRARVEHFIATGGAE